MHWFTANIGYHHVHHMNAAIPFYRLPEAMAAMPELQNPGVVTWSPKSIVATFRLKVWDARESPDGRGIPGLSTRELVSAGAFAYVLGHDG